jgi:hypothetical protein
MADRVDAAVQAVQASFAHAPRDRVVVEPAGAQLSDRQHAVALGGEAGDANVGGWFVLLASGASRTNHPLGHAGIVARDVSPNTMRSPQLCAATRTAPRKGGPFGNANRFASRDATSTGGRAR